MWRGFLSLLPGAGSAELAKLDRMSEPRLLSTWPRRMAADFGGLEADEALLRNASARTLALTLGAFPALLMPLPAATQTSIATVALTLYQGATSRPIARRASTRGIDRSGVLSVAIFRGSANANTERLAALLSLDARRFAVSLYTTQLARGDAEQLRRATEAHGRRWHHTPLDDAASDARVAELLQRRGCDVLLDCSGHTAGHRLTLLARRPCPVRVGALGFAGSYGEAALEYLTTDRVVVTPRTAAALAERVAVLPHTYQVPPEPPPPAHRAPPRPPPAELSVVARGPLLGTFVRASRLHPLSLSQWLATLRRVAGSRLPLSPWPSPWPHPGPHPYSIPDPDSILNPHPHPHPNPDH